ncbi:hypothetical protein [Actinomadura alba]|nr:hypothetical protein [Actinomadura alba]
MNLELSEEQSAIRRPAAEFAEREMLISDIAVDVDAPARRTP